VSDATLACPDLTTFCRLDELGLVVVGQHLGPDRAALTELRRLGRTLNRRAADVLASFDQPHTSNGPTQAINGRLEHLHGSA
jgi:hypothetical protein